MMVQWPLFKNPKTWPGLVSLLGGPIWSMAGDSLRRITKAFAPARHGVYPHVVLCLPQKLSRHLDFSTVRWPESRLLLDPCKGFRRNLTKLAHQRYILMPSQACNLVAVDPPAKSLTFLGFSGKPLDLNQEAKVYRSNPIAVKANDTHTLSSLDTKA